MKNDLILPANDTTDFIPSSVPAPRGPQRPTQTLTVGIIATNHIFQIWSNYGYIVIYIYIYIYIYCNIYIYTVYLYMYIDISLYIYICIYIIYNIYNIYIYIIHIYNIIYIYISRSSVKLGRVSAADLRRRLYGYKFFAQATAVCPEPLQEIALAPQESARWEQRPPGQRFCSVGIMGSTGKKWEKHGER